MLEIKTKDTTKTVTKIDEDIAHFDSKFNECKAGTTKFKVFVKEPSYRSQLCQHATATQLNYVMIAYAIPGGVIKRIALSVGLLV